MALSQIWYLKIPGFPQFWLVVVTPDGDTQRSQLSGDMVQCLAVNQTSFKTGPCQQFVKGESQHPMHPLIAMTDSFLVGCILDPSLLEELVISVLAPSSLSLSVSYPFSNSL